MKQKVIIKLLVILAGCGLFLFYRSVGIGCLFVHFFHVICPGCGMTRAIEACLRFDFRAAFQYHPMVFSLPLLFLFFITDGELFKNKYVNTVLILLMAAGFAANYAVKLLIYY